MYGAILGDIIGSPYEFDQGNKSKDFPLFSDNSCFTDDTVMTVAVAEVFLKAPCPQGCYVAAGDTAVEVIRQDLIAAMRKYGALYPRAGYGLRFSRWLRSRHPKPYNSFGHGSAMRVSPVGWLFDSLEKTLAMAELSAAVTHNHPEGIKGAQATAAAIYLARTGSTKTEIKAFIEENFQYDLSRTCDQIRPDYYHIESCQETVPEAITAFLEGESFEDVIRTAVSLGGDCDTLTAIAGSIAEAFYGVPEELKAECRSRLTPDLLTIVDRFYKQIA